MNRQIAEIELRQPPAASGSELEGRSLLLTAVSQHPDSLMLMNFDNSVDGNDSLERRFGTVEPGRDGHFRLELGVVLPDRLPAPPGKLDYFIDVPVGGCTESLRLCFSDQMLMLRYVQSGTPCHLLVPMFRLKSMSKQAIEKVPASAHYEPLKTFVTAQFDLHCVIVGSIVRESLNHCLDRFLIAVNRVTVAHLLTPSEMRTMLWPSYTRSSFSHVYLAAIGENETAQCHRYSTNLFQMPLHELNYDRRQWEVFLTQLEAGRSDGEPRLLLGAARSHLLRGEERFCLLEIAMAVELAATRFVSGARQRYGSSQSKLKERPGEMRFGAVLNNVLPVMIGDRADVVLFEEMNRIRRARNEFMHRASFGLKKADLLGMHSSASRFIELLEVILKEQVP